MQTLREMTKDELLLKHSDLLDEQFNLNMSRSLKALDNPLRLREIRREIAKIKTILTEDTKGIKKLADISTSILPDENIKGKKK
jgi:large subunit ribosomal protein L29